MFNIFDKKLNINGLLNLISKTFTYNRKNELLAFYTTNRDL